MTGLNVTLGNLAGKSGKRSFRRCWLKRAGMRTAQRRGNEVCFLDRIPKIERQIFAMSSARAISEALSACGPGNCVILCMAKISQCLMVNSNCLGSHCVWRTFGVACLMGRTLLLVRVRQHRLGRTRQAGALHELQWGAGINNNFKTDPAGLLPPDAFQDFRPGIGNPCVSDL